MYFPSAAFLASTLLAASAHARFVIYADEWHPTRPTNPQDRAGIDHIVLAFAVANATAAFQQSSSPSVSTIRSEFPNAKVMIAVGGWGDDRGFFQVSQTDASIQAFAADVATMLTNTGADGVDIDWEYPGGNGADYKQVPNSQKVYQIAAFPKVLAAVRTAIGDKLLSIAVPGKKGDMIAYTKENGPRIWPSVDYINVMSYDLMNRRDNLTKHHSSVAGSEDTIKNYLAIGAPPSKINLGFAYYAKYFTTQGDCGTSALGCPIVLAEDPATGADLLTSGAWTFEKTHMQPVESSALTVSYDGTCGPEKGTRCSSGCCSQYGNCGTSREHCSGACQHAFGTGCTDSDVAGSWQLASKNGVTDEAAGGQYYFDAENRLFWTWDTPELISRKFDDIVRKYKLGGVMAWSLGEDSYDWSHIRRMASEVAKDGYGQVALANLDASSSEMTPSAPVNSDAPSSSAVQSAPSSSSAAPYNVVFVDGTQQGPEGDYPETPASPPDYVVSFNGEELPEYTSAESTTPSAAAAPVKFSSSPEAPVAISNTQPSTSQPSTSQPSTSQPAPLEPTMINMPMEPENAPVQSSATTDQSYVAAPSEPSTIEPEAAAIPLQSNTIESAAAAIPNTIDPEPPATPTAAPPSRASSFPAEDWAIDMDTFSPDAGYVNPNWPPQEEPSSSQDMPGQGVQAFSWPSPPAHVPVVESAAASQDVSQPTTTLFAGESVQPPDVSVEPSAVVSSASSSSAVSAAAEYTGGASCRVRRRKKARKA